MCRVPVPPAALIFAALFAAAAPALAADPPAATLAATPVTPSVAAQIDDYLRTSPAVALPKDAASGVTPGEAPRQTHGVVSLAVGNHGYRSGYVRSDFPVGKTATLSIAVQQSQGDERFAGRYGGYGRRYGRQGVGLAFAMGDASPSREDARCAANARDVRWGGLDPMMTGGRRSPCPAADRNDPPAPPPQPQPVSAP